VLKLKLPSSVFRNKSANSAPSIILQFQEPAWLLLVFLESER